VQLVEVVGLRVQDWQYDALYLLWQLRELFIQRLGEISSSSLPGFGVVFSSEVRGGRTSPLQVPARDLFPVPAALVDELVAGELMFPQQLDEVADCRHNHLTFLASVDLGHLNDVEEEVLEVAECLTQVDGFVDITDDWLVRRYQVPNGLREVIGLTVAENVDDLLTVVNGELDA